MIRVGNVGDLGGLGVGSEVKDKTRLNTKLQSLLPEPPVYKPCISFDTEQSDYFVYCI